MSRFVQSLESRALFSVVSASALLGDVRQVLSSAVIARADLRSAVTAATSGLNRITTDLKTSTTSANRTSNAVLLKTLKSDGIKTFGTLKTDEMALLVVGASLSARAAADAVRYSRRAWRRMPTHCQPPRPPGWRLYRQPHRAT
jgi:hypothetical protein